MTTGAATARLTEGGPGSALLAWAVLCLGSFFVLIHLYAGIYGAPDALLYRAVHVCTALALVFLIKPLPGRWRWLDLLGIAGTLWVQVYFFIELETWHIRTVFFRPIDYATAVLFILLILEATRRVVGAILVLICAFFLAHALSANHFPGVFYGPPSSLQNLLQAVFLDSNGIFGTAVSVMANFVVLFILFGTLLNACGGGAFFTRLAFALFGHRTGGPAKAAVMSSAMMGSLSGSAIGNVLTTGVFTIPLMIRLGYRRAFAGGVEAAASNGGIIMPPVMGAVAFIMTEFLDRAYLDIVAAALIPALLYFLVIFVSVHTEARKLGLPRMPRALLPPAWAILRREGYLLAPILLIIGALIAGRSIVYVAVMITGVTFLIAVLQPRRRITPRGLVSVIEETARATVGLSVAAAAAGIILGAIFAVGLSFQIAQAAANAAGGQIWALLLLSALLSVIMGMGMTAVAIYLTLVATIIPILTVAGVPPMAAHFFAFYYGIISNITPPVALTAFAAAPIAKSNPMPVGLAASRLGIACFLLPILFVYAPGLLLETTWQDTLHVTVMSALGLSAFAVAMTGHAFAPLHAWQRAGALAVFVLGVAPDWRLNLAALALAALVFATNLRDGAAAARRGSATDGTVPEAGAEERRILADIMEERSAPDNDTLPIGEARGRWFWCAWAVVLGVAIAFEVSAQIFLQARAPLLWTLLMALTACG
ncbi:MAG: TRAP transporter fused permease subunit, partial [Pseudomonadota bacterium]